MITSKDAKVATFHFRLSIIFLVFVFLCVSLMAHLQAQHAIVQVWLTTKDGAYRLSQQPSLQLGSNGIYMLPTITVNDRQRLQQIDGFGAAMTDTSAWLIGTKMSSEQRDSVMRALFDPSSGIGISFVRIPMGSSDFTTQGLYSYDDMPPGARDPHLTNFSIVHDLPYILPSLQQALSLNPMIKFLATPWSAPAWMKTNASMLGSSRKQAGALAPFAYDAFAQYFVKFIQAYQVRGIPIYAIVPQNEPLNPVPTYAGMLLPARDEARFITQNLAPALNRAHLSTRILAYDQGMDHAEYARAMLSDAATRDAIAGTAWHCYSGDPKAMGSVHTAYPQKEIYETECSTGPTGIATVNAIEALIGAVQNWARTATLWNIALDTQGGPKMGRGCNGCTGLVTIDQASGRYTFTENYYQLGHLSKFVMPGAYHVASTMPQCNLCPQKLEYVAFKNPDKSNVLVVYNRSSLNSTFRVQWDSTQSFVYTLPAGAIVTFRWQQ